MSKPPLPPSSLPHSLSLPSLQPPRTAAASFFSSAAAPPRFLPILFSIRLPFLLLAPLWECSEGKRIVRGSVFSPPHHHQHRIYYHRDGLQSDSSRHAAVIPGNQSGWSRYGLDRDQLDLARFSGHHQQQHHPNLIGRSHQIPSALPRLSFSGFHGLGLSTAGAAERVAVPKGCERQSWSSLQRHCKWKREPISRLYISYRL